MLETLQKSLFPNLVSNLRFSFPAYHVQIKTSLFLEKHPTHIPGNTEKQMVATPALPRSNLIFHPDFFFRHLILKGEKWLRILSSIQNYGSEEERKLLFGKQALHCVFH